MSEPASARPTPKIRLWRYLPILIILGLAVHLLVPQITTLENSWIGFDILTLYFLFVAAGYNITLGVLFAGYGLPFILGKLAFIFPGGVGVIEGSMVAMYESLQVPNNISVVVILGYRLFSFWLLLVLGFVAASYLSSPQRGANSA